MRHIRSVALVAGGFFCALLVMYRFDFGMAVAVLAIAVVFGITAIALNRMPGL
jgi:energy-converting hydrogenase Eha subunit C